VEDRATRNVKERSMDRYTRRVYFERLCELRESYKHLGPEDTTATISIETAIIRGRALLVRRGSPLVLMLEGGQKTA
jgi:hypothetical protein